MTYGNGLVGTTAYNSRLQPCRISVKASGSAPTGCDDLTAARSATTSGFQ